MLATVVYCGGGASPAADGGPRATLDGSHGFLARTKRLAGERRVRVAHADGGKSLVNCGF